MPTEPLDQMGPLPDEPGPRVRRHTGMGWLRIKAKARALALACVSLVLLVFVFALTGTAACAASDMTSAFVPLCERAREGLPKVRLSLVSLSRESIPADVMDTTEGLGGSHRMAANALERYGMRVSCIGSVTELDVTKADSDRDTIEAALLCMLLNWPGTQPSILHSGKDDQLALLALLASNWCLDASARTALSFREPFTNPLRDCALETLQILNAEQTASTDQDSELPWIGARRLAQNARKLGIRVSYHMRPKDRPAAEIDVTSATRGATSSVQYVVGVICLGLASQTWGEPGKRPMIRITCPPEEEMLWRRYEAAFNSPAASRHAQTRRGKARRSETNRAKASLGSGRTPDYRLQQMVVPIRCGWHDNVALAAVPLALPPTESPLDHLGFRSRLFPNYLLDSNMKVTPAGARATGTGRANIQIDLRAVNRPLVANDWYGRYRNACALPFLVFLNSGTERPRLSVLHDPDSPELQALETAFNGVPKSSRVATNLKLFPLLAGSRVDDGIQLFLSIVADGTYPQLHSGAETTGPVLGRAALLASAIRRLGIKVSRDKQCVVIDTRDAAPDMAESPDMREAVETIICCAYCCRSTQYDKPVRIVSRPQHCQFWQPYVQLYGPGGFDNR